MELKRMIAVVQHYINVRKDKTISISIRSKKDISLLILAYNTALDWLAKNTTGLKLNSTYS